MSDSGGRDALPENASPKILEEERIYQANLKAAQVQMAHEITCPDCATYAAPSPGKPRMGRPCVIGMRYWSVPAGESGRKWEP